VHSNGGREGGREGKRGEGGSVLVGVFVCVCGERGRKRKKD